MKAILYNIGLLPLVLVVGCGTSQGVSARYDAVNTLDASLTDPVDAGFNPDSRDMAVAELSDVPSTAVPGPDTVGDACTDLAGCQLSPDVPVVVDVGTPDAAAPKDSGCPSAPPAATWPAVTIANGCATPVPAISAACAAANCANDQTCVGSGWCVPKQYSQVPVKLANAGDAGAAVAADGTWAVAYSAGQTVEDTVYLSVGKLAQLQLGAPLQVSDVDGGLHRMPAVVALTDGSWLVVWGRGMEAVNQPTSIQARHISADGSKVLGPQWQVNTTVLGDGPYSPGAYWGPVTERTQDGHVLVTWAGSLPAAAPWGVYGRLLAVDGSAAGAEFLIAGGKADENAGRPSLAHLSSDRIVAAWPQMAGGKNLATRIFVRQVTDGSTVSLGPATQVSPGLHKIESLPGIAAFGNDEVLVAWQANDGSSTMLPSEVFAQSWSLCGTPAPTGVVSKVGDDPSGGEAVNAQVLSMVGGRIVVLWQVYATPGADEIRARRFNPASGVWDCEVENLAGPVLAPETGWRDMPFSVALPGGGFLAGWNATVDPSPTQVMKLRAWAW